MRTAGVEATSLRGESCPHVGANWRVQHVWGVARQAALARDGFTCQTCGVTDWDAPLVVHHVIPITGGYGPSCEHHLEGLISLCVQCHREVHRWYRAGCPDMQLALAV